MREGDMVILVASGPTGDGIARLVRIDGMECNTAIVNDVRFPLDNPWALGEGSAVIRHRIEIDSLERRSYYRL